MEKMHWEQIQSIVGTSADGKPGEKTAGAIHKWQHENGETPTGVFEGKLKEQFGQRFSMMGMKLDGLLERGEGNYDSYNAGTLGTVDGKVKKQGKHDFSSMTINEILANSDSKNGNDADRYFAVGRYQIITPTLRSAKSQLGLSGEEKLTNQLQDDIYEAFLIPAKARSYIYGSSNDIEAAQNALAAVWRCIEYGSTGQTYPDSAAKANKSSVTRAEIHAALNEARQKFISYKTAGSSKPKANEAPAASQGVTQSPVLKTVEASGLKVKDAKPDAVDQGLSATKTALPEDKFASAVAKTDSNKFDVEKALRVSKTLGYKAERWTTIQKIVKSAVTGVPDNNTVAKVYQWQMGQADLVKDGIPGPMTWAKMEALAMEVAKEAKKATPQFDIARAVSVSKKLGYAVERWESIQKTVSASVTRMPDNETAEKVYKWQSGYADLENDGIPGTKTWAKMKSLSAKPEANVPKTEAKTTAPKETPKAKVDPEKAQTTPTPVENTAAPKLEPKQGANAPGAEKDDYLGEENIVLKSPKKKAVETMQKYLNHYGFNVGTVDGGFGHKTMTQLMYYQYTRNMNKSGVIQVDGECGPATWKAFRDNKAAVYRLEDELTFDKGVKKDVSVSKINSGGKLQTQAADKFNLLFESAKKAGIHLSTNTSVRCMTRAATHSLSGKDSNGQIEFFSGHKALGTKGGYNLAAPPGRSDHQTGISVDLANSKTTTSATYKWLNENAATYGFENDGRLFPQVEYWHWTYMPLKK